MKWLAAIAGLGIVVTVMADVFLAVLYARTGTGILSVCLNDWIWRIFRTIGGRVPRKTRDWLLSFGGPTILVTIIFAWIGLLVLGFGLMFWPAMGWGVVAASGPTPTDLITACSYAGDAMTTVGSGELYPHTPFYRMLAFLASFLGIATLTLAVTYILQIYDSLHSRNTFALKLHHATKGTGDAAQFIAGLGPDGNFEDARGALTEIAAELMSVYEAHHFYGSLHYFRFRELYYGMARVSTIIMDTVTLLRTVLDDDKYHALKKSFPVTQLWDSGMQSLVELSKMFLRGPAIAGGVDDVTETPDEPTIDRWRQRFMAAVQLIQKAGIPTVTHVDAAAERYIAMRRQWNPYVIAFATFMCHDPSEMDPAGSGE